MKKITRRNALKLGAIASGTLLLPIGLQLRNLAADEPASPKTPLFQIPLPIPPILNPIRSDGTTDYYEITQQQAQVEILPGLKTTIWGYNGQFPGPTIKGRVGRQTVVRQINNLPQPVVTHLHGMPTLPEYDGYPDDYIQPGQSKDYIYPNTSAATYWYHDHTLHKTAINVYQGLAGFYIIQDAIEDNLPLPKGDYDIPLMIQDVRFNSDGSLFYTPDGDTILVNGAPSPHLEVANRKYRFRILNSSVSTPFQLGLSSGQPLLVIGTDLGLMSAPQSVNDFRIGPGERYEVIIDFSKYSIGTQVVLKNLFSTGSFGQVMRFDVVRGEKDDSHIPATLRNIEIVSESVAVQSRDFLLDQINGVWVINRQGFDPNSFIATPKLGDVEIWRFHNDVTFEHHLMHPHLVHFRILYRNGNPPFSDERGLKDTVYVGPSETVWVLMKFVPHKGKYVMHCHDLDREDNDMMTQFNVV